METRAFAFWLVLAHVIFYALQCFFTSVSLEDSVEYLQMAENIWKSNKFYSAPLEEPINEVHFTKRPPAYPLFLLLTFANSSIYVTLAIQNLISVTSILTIRKIFMRYFGRPKWWLEILIIVTGISQFFYANLVMSEILVQVFLVLSIYCVYKSLTSKSIWWLILFQICVALFFLTKPVFYLFVIPNLIITYYICRKANLRFQGFTGLLPVVVLLIVCHWNFRRTGSYDYSSIQTINLIHYNLNYFYHSVHGEEVAERTISTIYNKTDHIDDYATRNLTRRKLAAEKILAYPFHYTGFHLMGSVRMFFDPGRFDHIIFFDLEGNKENGLLKALSDGDFREILGILEQHGVLFIWLLFLFLLAIAKAVGFVIFLIKRFKFMPIPVTLGVIYIFYIAILTGPIGASRFLVPVLPIYLYISIYGLQFIDRAYFTGARFRRLFPLLDTRRQN